MNDKHFRQVQAIVEESNRLAENLAEKLGKANAIEPLFLASSKLWYVQFPKGTKLHLNTAED
jgi:hypothetical protein